MRLHNARTALSRHRDRLDLNQHPLDGEAADLDQRVRGLVVLEVLFTHLVHLLAVVSIVAEVDVTLPRRPAWRRRRPEPASYCRASCGSARSSRRTYQLAGLVDGALARDVDRLLGPATTASV